MFLKQHVLLISVSHQPWADRSGRNPQNLMKAREPQVFQFMQGLPDGAVPFIILHRFCQGVIKIKEWIASIGRFCLSFTQMVGRSTLFLGQLLRLRHVARVSFID